LNLEEYSPGAVDEETLAVEDRWILSRLTTVTGVVTEALDSYRFADAARCLYDFAWDEFCSFYIEMIKGRLQDPQQGPLARRVLAHTLDTLLRLLHPMVPFITEEIWQLLGRVAPRRGVAEVLPAAGSIEVAPWPAVERRWQNEEIEQRFARFQEVLGAIREIRSRQNIPPRASVDVFVQCDASIAQLLRPMDPYFQSLAGATVQSWGSQVQPPSTHAAVSLNGIDVFVDLQNFIDVAAEIERNEKLETRLRGQIEGKQRKLSNSQFVQRAPADVVQKEREGLAELESQLAAAETALQKLRAME
jgi:valyl-tRNA synthetase